MTTWTEAFAMTTSRVFHYGTNYWRPRTPRREEHRFHLTRIKRDLGFDVVVFRLLWNWHHREADRFLFDEVHELFDICDAVDLRAIITINLESAPYWLEQEHPDARYVNANGRAIELGSQEAHPTGGHPGLCFHHPAVREHAERFMRWQVREFRERKSLYAYDCWNEPHQEPAWCNNMWGNMGDRVFCYCQASRLAFRRWLHRRYGDVDRLNEAWGRAYTSFGHINPPILQGHYADWLDWFRFWYEELADNMRWRVQTIKAEDPAHPVVSHSGAVPPILPRANAMIHNWKFAEPVDAWGTSFAPQAFGWPLSTCAMVMEMTRGAARGKDYWISEMPGGPANINGFRKSRTPTAQDYRTWNWLSVAYGSRATIHWCYQVERTGQEAGGFGMVTLDGAETPRSRAAAAEARLLRQHADVFMRSVVEAQAAVLYDPDNSSLLFAMELGDERYAQSHLGYYRAIWNADLIARYITYDTLDDVKERILIVPMALTMPDRIAERLAGFVAEGGVLIADVATGLYDEHGYMRRVLPAGRLAEAAGLTEGELLCSDPENRPTVPTADGRILREEPADAPLLDPLALGPPVTFGSPVAATVPVHGYLAPLRLAGAQPWGMCGDLVLAARHTYGKGEVYYLGTYLGLALDKDVRDAHALLTAVLHRYARPIVRGDRLRPRLIDGGSAALLVVFNDNRREAVSESVAIPERFRKARDIHTDEVPRLSDNKVTIRVGPEEVVVLLLEG
jgi:beta-galactosidase GanA